MGSGASVGGASVMTRAARRRGVAVTQPRCRSSQRVLRGQAPIYECPACESRYLGDQYCPDCRSFCRRVGPGGLCPACEEPVAIADLLPNTTHTEVIARNS